MEGDRIQYINFYFTIYIATTFVSFQIAVYAYIVLRTFTYKTGQVARVNAQRVSCSKTFVTRFFDQLCNPWTIIRQYGKLLSMNLEFQTNIKNLVCFSKNEISIYNSSIS